jgi:hypothetical protein
MTSSREEGEIGRMYGEESIRRQSRVLSRVSKSMATVVSSMPAASMTSQYSRVHA